MTYINKFSIRGKTAIVTGGAGILGSHFCRGLADAGASVAVVDIDVQKATEVANSITKNFEVKAKGIFCDLTSEQSVIEMVESVVKEFGTIDILHNNAAGKSSNLNAFFAPFEEYELDQWKEIMSTNLDSMFLVAKHVGKIMKEQGNGGSIIQTASIYGVMGPDNRIYDGSYYYNRQINTPAIYSASKGGVVALTKYLATYWAKDGIRVNTITPGGVESGQNETFKQNYGNRIPLGRMAQAEEMVGALIYLASDASSYVTGQNILIDGGLSAW
ncbi:MULTISPECIES: SDR family oxidoreductase [Lysinibacillus]|uniref:SDR family oxidoreductase n=1 Tax=Lysinibacillus TaxID=400634 RepID=UPI000BBAFE67|nr:MULTISPECIES: SDR family oxidoreductase [Lysinibacillus]PCD83387.1 short-chain dehydrogenase [Lysinibacillus fusiformis]PIJ99402.1 short-chain dehydrogenase [Lysinibacillus sphaericus]QIC48477.1 SDR family oxidoreductase [Lysinibacillus sphaericus]QTB27691.1 SDR family oxidoreductase [Lysinibacillus sphaericus]